MDSVMVAHLSLWVLIAGLLVLVVLLSRQLSDLHARVAPAGALSVNAVLEVGQRAPGAEVRTLEGVTLLAGRNDDGRCQLLFFLAPDCPISRSLTPVLATFGRTEPWLDVVLASDGGIEADHLAFAATGDLAGLPYVLSEDLGRAYGVSKLPYAVLVDEHGRIAGMGIVNSREHLESLFEARESGISTIQEFMRRSESFRDDRSLPADGGGVRQFDVRDST